MGTGVVGFNSGFPHAVMSDANPHLIRFYRSVESGEVSPESVRGYLETESALLSGSGDGQERFREVRDRFNETGDPHDFLFLSRAGFNGMMRFNRSGKWNVPFCKKPKRFSKSYITKISNQVSAVSNVCKGWEFNCEDFREAIKKAEAGDLIYCDPPYSGRNSDYFNDWDEKDDDDLFRLLEDTEAFFILSTWHHNDFRQNPFADRFKEGFRVLTKEHFYHIGGNLENRRFVTEALILNFSP